MSEDDDDRPPSPSFGEELDDGSHPTTFELPGDGDAAGVEVAELRAFRESCCKLEAPSSSNSVQQLVLAVTVEDLVRLLAGTFKNSKSKKELEKIVTASLVKSGLVCAGAFTEELTSVKEQFRLSLRGVVEKAFDFVRESLEPPSVAPNSLVLHHKILSTSPNRTRSVVKDGSGGEQEILVSSRYFQDFEEIEPLGKGGFGKVFKVRCHLDGREYAVKKIPVDIFNQPLYYKILREVKFLARLNHAHIVRYYSAWPEFDVPLRVPREARRRRASRRTSEGARSKVGLKIRELDEESDTNEHLSEELRLRRTISTPEISFALSLKDGEESGGEIFSARRRASSSGEAELLGAVEEDSSGSFGPLPAPASVGEGGRGAEKRRIGSKFFDPSTGTGQSSGSTAECTEEQRALVPVEGGGALRRPAPVDFLQLDGGQILRFGGPLILYLQMELCSFTLREYLNERNHLSAAGGGADDAYARVDPDLNRKTVRDLLSALAYIHSLGIVHRDVKPSNIFFRLPDYHVLLGDFGLACLADPARHSRGVGTETYSAPEQLRSNEYGSKVDIYSAGIVAFEMYQPFWTESEKLELVNRQARRGHIPGTFEERWRREARLIRRMVQNQPARRPSADELLDDDFFMTKEERIRRLEATVHAQAEEIRQLKEMLELSRK